MIKDVSRELAYPLCFLINLSLQKGIFPSVEKVAKVTPIYKAEEFQYLEFQTYFSY